MSSAHTTAMKAATGGGSLSVVDGITGGMDGTEVDGDSGRQGQMSKADELETSFKAMLKRQHCDNENADNEETEKTAKTDRPETLSLALIACIKDLQEIRTLPYRSRSPSTIKKNLEVPSKIRRDSSHTIWNSREWTDDAIDNNATNFAILLAIIQRKDRWADFHFPRCDDCQSLFCALKDDSVWKEGSVRFRCLFSPGTINWIMLSKKMDKLELAKDGEDFVERDNSRHTSVKGTIDNEDEHLKALLHRVSDTDEILEESDPMYQASSSFQRVDTDGTNLHANGSNNNLNGIAGATSLTSVATASMQANGCVSFSDSGEEDVTPCRPDPVLDTVRSTGVKFRLPLEEESGNSRSRQRVEAIPDLGSDLKSSIKKKNSSCSSSKSRLSWDPSVVDNSIQCELEPGESSDEEEHPVPIIQEMKDGNADALVNAVVQVQPGLDNDDYQALILSVNDGTTFTFNVERNAVNSTNEWEGEGRVHTVVLNPLLGNWSVIGNKSQMGRISFKSSKIDLGATKATGRRYKKKSPNANKKRKRDLDNTPTVVRQKRTTYKQTPTKGSKKRKNDFKLQVCYDIVKRSESWLPNHTPNSRLDLVSKVLPCKDSGGGKEDSDMQKLAQVLKPVMVGKKPKERRHLMSMFAGAKIGRENAEKILGCNITPYEWTKAIQHALYPGIGVMPKVVKSPRQRFKLPALLGMMGLIDEHFLQRVAYGDKDFQTSHGAIISIDAVNTTATAATIARSYADSVNPNGKERTEHQCNKRHSTSLHYCLRDKDHEGRCKFTPDGALSTESLRKFLSTLTNGQQKSFAGLDDEMVHKGTNNVKRLREIYECASVDESEGSRKSMYKRIDHILDFHQTVFGSHLKEEEGKCCQCIPCGLHTEAEPIPCQMRGHHDEACKDCEESFQVISDIKSCIEKRKSRENISKEEAETYHELLVELNTCRQNLIDYRSHIVRKTIEAAFTRGLMQSLTPFSCIVIIDWKMKILPMYYRESQQDFFGKRSPAGCLGVLMLTKSEVEGEVNAQYLFLYTDDTCQDANMVLSAKSYLYGEYIPSLFPDRPDGTPIEVHCETDGAGCFNAMLMKACQPMWFRWTDGQVEEIEIRHSVNGCGKSCLDGAFGAMTRGFKARVNEGMDITDSKSALKAFQAGPNKNAAAVLLEVDRSNDIPKVVPSAALPLLLSSHRLVLDRAKETVTCYTHSGFGSGQSVPFSRLRKMLPENATMPEYKVTEGEDTDENVGVGRCREAVTHSTESQNYRDEKKKTLRREKKQKDCDDYFFGKIEKAKAQGVYMCPERRPHDLAPCRCKYSSKRKYLAHLQSGKHEYPKQNLIERSATLLSGRLDGSLAVGFGGARMNRNEQFYNEDLVKDGTGTGTAEGDEWKQPGCYTKADRKKPQQKSKRLIHDLIRLYEEGESNSNGGKKSKNKYTPQEALDLLRGMRNPSGLRTYSGTSIFGTLPTVSQIRSYWSGYKKVRKSGADAEDIEEFLADGFFAGMDGHLQDIHLFLNGEFDDEEEVKSSIEAMGGTVSDKLSQKTDFIVLGENPNLKTKLKPGIRFTTWDRLHLLSEGEIHLEGLHEGVTPPVEVKFKSASKKSASKKSSSLKSGVLGNKKVLLNGNFENKAEVEAAIEELGGTIQTRASKNLDFIVQGTNPKKKRAGEAGSKARFLSWDEIQGLQEGEINLDDLPSVQINSSSISPSGVLRNKMLLLDGSFENKAEVKAAIEELGGTIQTRASKNLDFIVQGTNPKKKRAGEAGSKTRLLSWDQIQRLQEGEINLDDLFLQTSRFDIDNLLSTTALPANEFEEVNKFLHGIRPGGGKRPDNETLMKLGSTTLKQSSLHRLTSIPIPPQQDKDLWLDDNVMDSLIYLLRERDAEICRERVGRKPTYFAGSFFYSKLSNEYLNDKKTEARVCKKSPCKNLLLHSACYFPIFRNGNHWAGSVILCDEKKILVYDPMGIVPDNKLVLDNLYQLVNREWRRLEDPSIVDVDGWELKDVSPTEEDFKQKNGYDCGIFTLLFMSHHSQNLSIRFKQDQICNCCGEYGVRIKLVHLLWKMWRSDKFTDLCEDDSDDDESGIYLLES